MADLSGTLGWPAAITGQMSDASARIADPPDGELVQRTADGDREAFATLYRRHHATIYRFARLMTGSNDMAEDVVQEVFLVLMRNAGRFDSSRSALSTYLYGVARHHTRRRLFRERRFVAVGNGPPALDERSGEDVAADLERRSEVQRLRRAIVSLPSRYREVVVLCDLHDVTYGDAAAALGCAIGTVRSRLHRARQLLIQKMRNGTGDARVPGTTLRCSV